MLRGVALRIRPVLGGAAFPTRTRGMASLIDVGETINVSKG